MAPRAGGTRARGLTGRARGGGRNAARSQRKDDGIPEVYRELMHAAGAGPSAADVAGDESQPRKRPRRAGDRVQQEPAGQVTSTHEEHAIVQVASSPLLPERPPQTIEDDSESDLEFEDVELGNSAAEDEEEDALPEPMKGLEEGLTVTIKAPGKNTPARARRKRRPVTSAERSVRLAIHKMHVLYLLYHVFYRNHWCNDEVTQAMLKQIATPRIVQLLNPDPRASQAQSSSFFLLGMSQLCDLFHSRFKITSLGMRRPRWLAEKADLAIFQLHEKTEKPLELADFRRAANSMQGSADLGAQLFCCLLRSVGVEARLVCSLQPLGFASAAELAPPAASAMPVKKRLYLQDPEGTPTATTNGNGSSTETPTSRRIARIGQPRSAAPESVSQASPSLSEKSSQVERPSYPVFWVEALNTAHQKWIAVDTVATHSVGKPSRLEPGINDSKNCMTYVIAFEESGVARDVTRRYTKAFIAKTRKLRVESTDNGTSWLRKALKLFQRPRPLDRDALEDAELTAKAAMEGMPKNVQDFRNHPLYTLERHLRRNEIIHPKHESGRINAGTANNPKFESVYRSANVHVVKSADKWFRLGREIKIGEQPMKHAMPRRGTHVRESPLDPEVVEEVGVGLYAAFQTQVYVPPAVGPDGKIPKNQYGNIDIYVPSMIPAGAVWIRMPEAKHAAKLLKIDYADTVTGFDFKGRHGTVRVDGVVVAEENFEAMEVACEAIREGREEESEADRRREVLRLWRRFLVGMREVDRIEGYLRDEDKAPDVQRGRNVAGGGEEEEGDGGGGFIVDDGNGARRPTRTRPQRNRPKISEDAGGFLEESGDESDGGGGRGYIAESSDGDSGSGGGFLPEEETVTEDDIGDGEDEGGGGFLPDNEEEAGAAKDDPPVGGTADAVIADDSPFGFVSIRIPELSRAIWDGHEPRVESSLSRVIRGMRRSQQQQVSVSNTDGRVEEHLKPTRSRIDQAIEELEAAPPAQKSATVRTPQADGQVEQDPAIPEDTPVVEETEISLSRANDNPTEKATPAPHQQGEAPVSSYDYDDDMLLEDPDDEDAEPEWLV